MDIIKSKIMKEGEELKKEVRERTVGYILTSLGLVAGLAWNEAIKSFIDYIFPLSANGLLAKIIYAVIVTAIVVSISVYLMRFLKKEGGSS